MKKTLLGLLGIGALALGVREYTAKPFNHKGLRYDGYHFNKADGEFILIARKPLDKAGSESKYSFIFKGGDRELKKLKIGQVYDFSGKTSGLFIEQDYLDYKDIKSTQGN